MAVYGRMLVGVGGGLIHPDIQIERNGDANIIIGLGGTGCSAVTNIKREVYKQLKPDDPDSAYPRYDSIKFLVVDSDVNDLRKQQKGIISDIDENNEFFSISNHAIQNVFADRRQLELRPELSWMNMDIYPDTAKCGAAGIRQVGRYLLVDRANAFYAKIQSLVTAALAAAKGTAVNVHVFAGISGGTGSGTFLDVCYLVRKALNEAGKDDARICGYFFMPDVNLSVPAIAESSLLPYYIKVNGYAALKELDYCMNFSRNHGSFDMNYGFTEIHTNAAPVDTAYLVSATDSEGNIINKGYQNAMDVCAEHIINCLSAISLNGVDDNDRKDLSIKGYFSCNKRKEALIRMQHGAGLCYSTLGVSTAVMPFTDILTYLGGRLFGAYENMYDKIPFKQDIDDFMCNKAKIDYDSIVAQLVDGCQARPILGDMFNADLFAAQNNKPFIAAVDEYYNRNKEALTRNAANLTAELKDYDIDGDGTSLLCRTFKELFETYAVNLDYGPVFANRMLFMQNNPNIVTTIEGYIARCTEDIEARERRIPLRKRDLDMAEARMREANFFNKKKRCGEYTTALCAYYRQLYETEVFTTLKRVLITYKDILNKLDIEFFQILTNVLENVRETCKINIEYLEHNNNAEELICRTKILSVNDIKDRLDLVIGNTDVEQTFSILMNEMLTNYRTWIGQDSNKITKLITDFVRSQFEKETERTIEEYLRDKYDVQTPAELVQMIKDNILEGNLWDKSEPIFWKNHGFTGDTVMSSSIMVPHAESLIVTAANDFAGTHYEARVISSNIIDRITVTKHISGIPLYAYQGIHEYEHEYENDRSKGRHLFETEEYDWNKFLPSPIPDSFSPEKSSFRIQARNNKAKEEFSRACELGVIVESNDGSGEWFLLETDSVDLASYKGEIISAKKESEKKAAVDKLLALKEELLNNANKILLKGGKPYFSCEKEVMMDFYLLSPVMNARVRDEIVRIEAINAIIAETIQIIKESHAVSYNLLKGSSVMELRDFRLAVYTGVISYGRNITYTYCGLPFQMDKRDMPYGRSGAYQAFLTYKELDPEIKTMIASQAKEIRKLRTDEEVAEVSKVVANLQAILPTLIKTYLMSYEGNEAYDEMKKFYEDFMSELDKFKRINML